ncbi:MAG: ABC transporter substrate-binding protein [Terrimicrobiaceae bacterium]
MFYAMAENLIDLRGYRFEHILQDIQTLNERAMRQELDITAVSIHAFAHLTDKYALLPSGASMGDGYGPMFVTTENGGWGDSDESRAEWLRGQTIAVPGLMTSAYLAAQLFLGADFPHVVIPFDKIFQAMHDGRATVGLIIHEGQLTFQDEGLHLVHDLGEWWKRTRSLPLPLGGNVVRRDLPANVQADIRDILHESISYGLAHRAPAVSHSMAHARGMDIPLADRFIGMYVNELTLDYGPTGRDAVKQFLTEANALGLIPDLPEIAFV